MPTLHVVLAALLFGIVLISMSRTVFVVRRSPSRAARWSASVSASIVMAMARRLGGRPRALVLDGYVVLSLILLAATWAAGLAPLVLLFGDTTVLIATMLLLHGAVHLHVTQLLTRRRTREREVNLIAGEFDEHRDVAQLIGHHLSGGSRERADYRFKQWAEWLIDLDDGHAEQPMLIFCGPSGAMSWTRAAVVVLDAAALIDAVAPSWTPPSARCLLHSGTVCIRRAAEAANLVAPSTQVSLQENEEMLFNDSVRRLVSAGVPLEYDVPESWVRFQTSRARYAHHASAIDFRLMYRTVCGRR